MQKQISKKIIFYLFLLLILGTLNNKSFSEFSFKKDYSFNITSLSQFNDKRILQKLSNYNDQNLFFLNKDDIIKTLNNFNDIENFYIFKNYPSNLIVKIEKAEYLAIIQKNGFNYYIGSNGNLIKIENDKADLPFIFGNIEIKEFLEFKDLIDNSSLNFSEIKNLYYFKSKRWDIETKSGLLVKLPRQNLNNSLEILMSIIKNKNLKNINNIDLRQINQIILNG